MSDLPKTIRSTIDRDNLLPRGGTVVVGVSGGPDSLCLLHVLRALAPEYGIALHVAHLNHKLREAESDQDAAFVAQLAGEWGLPCTVEVRSVSAYARRAKLAVEEAARQMRYGFLAEVAQHVGSETVAVAHHADDQAESVLMHVIRGSGLAGLRGMRPRSEIGDLRLADLQAPISNLQLIRPLLYVTRAEIEAYCAAHGLKPRFDVSNLDQTYFRNWLRHTVLPLLAQHNPGVREVLCRAAEVASADYDVLHAETERVWPQVTRVSTSAIVFDRAAWQALSLSLKRATIRKAIHRLRQHLRNINFVHVGRAVDLAERGKTGDRATVTEGLTLTVSYDSFTLADDSHSAQLPNWPLLEPGGRVAVPIPGVCILSDSKWALESEFLQQRDQEVQESSDSFVSWCLGGQDLPDPWAACLDAEACEDPLMLRTRLPGDRMVPQGMGGHHIKLGEMMINAKIPRHARDRMPLLVSGERILWACGLRVDERARITSATRRVVRLRFSRLVG
jgi:tRNA(Ile)-lysidine synthetase-like protein